MNKISIEQNTTFNVEQDLLLVLEKDASLVFNIDKEGQFNIYIYNINHSLNINVSISTEAICNLYYSNINYDNNNYKIEVNHLSSNSEVNLYNHGVNVNDKKLVYNVSSKVGKDTIKCITNQDNRIINIKNGKSIIYPILLIDNYDVSSSHSAYIGKFSDDIIFYLQSRGLSLEKAYELLLKGFLVYNEEEIDEFLLELSKI